MQERGKIPWGYIIPALIILAVIIGVIYIQTRSGGSTTGTPGPGSGNFPFSCVPASATPTIHIHPWLRIVINGKNVTIPQSTGITAACLQPMHTHDSSGLIHIEISTNSNYTLENFFQIWAATYAYAIVNGAREPIVFNNTDILGFKVNSSSDSLKLLVDGNSPPAGDFVGSSTQYGNLVLNVLQYCSSSQPAYSTPCYPTDANPNTGAIGDPEWNGLTGFAPTVSGGYPYGGNHTIVIDYTS